METDEFTTKTLINAFAQALGDLGGVEASVDGTAQALRRAHTGQAAHVFQQGMGEWLAGLRQLRQALLSLDDDMQSFARLTSSTEDDNQLAAAEAFLRAGS